MFADSYETWNKELFKFKKHILLNVGKNSIYELKALFFFEDLSVCKSLYNNKNSYFGFFFIFSRLYNHLNYVEN